MIKKRIAKIDEDRILTEEEKELLEQSYIDEKEGKLISHDELMKELNK